MGTLDPDFSDEVVVVTGASSGIGRAVALAFGAAGAVVVNADVRPEPKDPDAEAPTHEAIENAGGVSEYVETDVSDPERIERALDLAREYGGVEVMINNAGVYTKRRFREVTPEEFDSVYQVNARGAFFGTQLAANDMIERGVAGNVVNTASTTQGRAA